MAHITKISTAVIGINAVFRGLRTTTRSRATAGVSAREDMTLKSKTFDLVVQHDIQIRNSILI